MVRYTEFGCPGDTSLLPTQPKDRFHPLVVLQFNPPSACPQLRGKHLVFLVGPDLEDNSVGRWTASLWDQGGEVHVLQSLQAAPSLSNTLNKIHVESEVTNYQWLQGIQFTKDPPLIILTRRKSTDYVKAGSALVSEGGQGTREKDGLVATIGGTIDGTSDKDNGEIG